MEYNLNQKVRTLDKVFKAGFIEEKQIMNLQIEDILKIKGATMIDVNIISEFKKAIKDKKVFQFLISGIK